MSSARATWGRKDKYGQIREIKVVKPTVSVTALEECLEIQPLTLRMFLCPRCADMMSLPQGQGLICSLNILTRGRGRPCGQLTAIEAPRVFPSAHSVPSSQITGGHYHSSSRAQRSYRRLSKAFPEAGWEAYCVDTAPQAHSAHLTGSKMPVSPSSQERLEWGTDEGRGRKASRELGRGRASLRRTTSLLPGRPGCALCSCGELSNPSQAWNVFDS